MTDLMVRQGSVVDEDEKKTYAGMYILKKMDLKPEDGGMVFPIVLPSDLTPVSDLLVEMAADGLVEMHKRKDRWELTKKGLAYLAELIDEAEDLIEELDELEVPEAIAELRARNLDVLRARYVWGWFDGEFDDLVAWQQRRGVKPVETLWAYYLTSDEFYQELAKDLEV
jgi:hypothetical protein